MSTLLPQPRPERSQEEVMAAFESTPLFMKSLPEDAMDDPVISALQSLAHEGTPDEVADNFKDQGNDYFRGKRYREALGFYTQGVDAKPTDNVLLEALLCNRAACNLELKNYGNVLKDCSKALSLNAKCSKAYYRSALALLALEREEEALDCCDRCLAYDSENQGVRSVKGKALKKKEEKDRRVRERQERVRKEQEEKAKMHLAFQKRNLIPVVNPDGPSENPYSPHFDPADPTQETLVIPVFFLYPQYATSDIISHFIEDTPFSAHIAAMFPPEAPKPEWDNNSEYIAGGLVVYAMTCRKRLLKVGKNMTLKDVFQAAAAKEGQPKDGLEVKDGCLTFVVLPKGDVEKRWVEEFKRTRDGGSS
ncbi:TTC4 family protein [Abortiporus biennis]